MGPPYRNRQQSRSSGRALRVLVPGTGMSASCREQRITASTSDGGRALRFLSARSDAWSSPLEGGCGDFGRRCDKPHARDARDFAVPCRFSMDDGRVLLVTSEAAARSVWNLFGDRIVAKHDVHDMGTADAAHSHRWPHGMPPPRCASRSPRASRMICTDVLTVHTLTSSLLRASCLLHLSAAGSHMPMFAMHSPRLRSGSPWQLSDDRYRSVRYVGYRGTCHRREGRTCSGAPRR